MNEGLSVADVMAMNGGNQAELWNNPFIYLVWLAVLGGGGLGNMFGGGGAANMAAFQGGLTRADLSDGLNTLQIENGIRDVNGEITNGFYSMNTSMLNGFNGVERGLCNGFNSVNNGINTLGYKLAECCCNTNRNIDAVRFENAQNTCTITNAMHEEGERTRALIVSNTIQDLRDRLEAKDREVMVRELELSQLHQSADLIKEIKPCPIPAYLTINPYHSFDCGYNYGCPR